MDINDPQWDDYERAFRVLAQMAELWYGTKPALDSAHLYLCLYGENGLLPAEEISLLEQLKTSDLGRLYRLEVEADYWQDTILFRWN